MVPVWIRPWLLGALCCYGIFGLYWYYFVGYAHGWQRTERQKLDSALVEPLDWSSLEAVSAGADTLLTLASRGRDAEAEACSRNGRCRRQCRHQGRITTGPARPVFNCLVAVPEAEPGSRQQRTERLLGRSGSAGLTYLLRGDGERVAVVARLRGEVEALRCGPNGSCYLIAELPGSDSNTVFASTDNGHHWHLAAHDVLPKAYTPRIAGVARREVWVDGFRRLSYSADGGQSWRMLVDDERVAAYRPGLLHGRAYTDRLSDHFRWHRDDAGRLYAVTGGHHQSSPDTVIYQVAHDGRILNATQYDGAFSWFELGPDGRLFGLYESHLPVRNTLYRLEGNAARPVLATGHEWLRSLRASRQWLMLARGRGDGAHLRVSRDGGQQWRAMADIYFGKRTVFDPSGAGILHFGYKNRGDRIPYYWQRP